VSFDFNPYHHIQVVRSASLGVDLYCHSCGKQWGDWNRAIPVERLFDEMATHVGVSHGRAPEDFRGWSDL